MTLIQSKAWLKNNYSKGAQCPCCHQYVKLYKRALNSGMAKLLINIYTIHRRYGNFDFLQINEELTRIGEIAYPAYASLAYWKLLEPMKHQPNHKKYSGKWRITKSGIMFVENRMKVCSHVILYNKNIIGFDGPQVSIEDCLGILYDYNELMNTKVKEL